MGSKMMRDAAALADTWNTMSFLAEIDQHLAETTERMSRMAAYCESVERDPATLRHSYLMFDADARQNLGRVRYYDSPEAFADEAGRLLDLGFTELGLRYPMLDSQVPVFETIATEVIPELRKAYD
jgi:alkanesulfonate monooxygenase SsuD/methylene tetrahydromethanopterin reductase-like flavin-dependent oxidoreductase (luciferase family)